MGFFDRVANLGKGVGKVWTKSAKEAFDQLQRGVENWDDDGDSTADPTQRKLRLLEQMRDEGLLSEVEYREKRLSVLGGPEELAPKRRTARSLDPMPDAEQDEPAPDNESKKDKPRKRNL